MLGEPALLDQPFKNAFRLLVQGTAISTVASVPTVTTKVLSVLAAAFVPLRIEQCIFGRRDGLLRLDQFLQLEFVVESQCFVLGPRVIDHLLLLVI